MSPFPLKLQAVKVSQPMGDFYAVAIPAKILRPIVFLDPTRIESVDRSSFLYRLLGNQRDASTSRAREIAKYINTVESAFPNSIILAANYVEYGSLQEDPARRWKVGKDSSGLFLTIPTAERMASVVDGQHRLLGFDYCKPERRDMELLCAVYMDLPQAYQAYLFATININQRKVNKSLAYEQFGYNLDDEKPEGWAPDKLAVFFTRKLNLNPESPLHQHIKIAPLEADLVFQKSSDSDWVVSTACIVEGIVSLVSARPKIDRDLLHSKQPNERNRSGLPQDGAPFRDLFRQCQDEVLWGQILGFFSVVKQTFWAKASEKSFIKKTIGVQALFDVFRVLGLRFELDKLSQEVGRVAGVASAIDFGGDFFQASGKGRVRVKNVILRAAGLIGDADLPAPDRVGHRRPKAGVMMRRRGRRGVARRGLP